MSLTTLPANVSINIEGLGSFLTVKEFSRRTGRKPDTIRKLITYGNSVRKLKAIKQPSHLLIPESELYNFPFVEPGRIGDEIRYHKYNPDGTIKLLSEPVE